MHINFDNDEIEINPTFDPKKKAQSQPEEEKEEKVESDEEDLNFNSTEQKEEKRLNFDDLGESQESKPKDDFFGSSSEEKEPKGSSFFGESQKEEPKDDFFGASNENLEVKQNSFLKDDTSKGDSFEIKNKSTKIEEKIEKSEVMSIDLTEVNSKLDEIKGVAQTLKSEVENLKDVDNGAIENITSEFEKIKGQIKSQSEEIKTNLDEVKSTIEKSREDIKLNISKVKVSADMEGEKKEEVSDKKSLLKKKASTDSLFRVIFFMIFITLATVVYFGITIMEDLAKKGSGKIIERVVPAKLPANVTATKVDTTKFENEAKAIRGEISNLNRNLAQFQNILNEIKNMKVATQVMQTPTITPIATSTETQKEVIKEVKFDDSSINQKLNMLSSEFDKISDKLNQINSKLSKVTNEVVYGKKELINKIDIVEKGLGYKIDARTPKPIKIYPDGLQIRDE